MSSSIESAWHQLDECTAALRKRANDFARAVERLAAASSDGDLRLAAETLSELAVAFGDLESTRVEAVTATERIGHDLAETEGFERELVAMFSEAFPESKVFSGFQSVFVYPIRLVVKPSASGVDVQLRGQRTQSRRPSRITGLVKEALKETRPPEQFAKTLHRAFRALREGKESGPAPLRSLYEVLAAGPTGSAGYSSERFATDLQALYVHLSEPISVSSGVVLDRQSFDAADAAKGYPIYLPDGSSVVLGYVNFVTTSGDSK